MPNVPATVIRRVGRRIAELRREKGMTQATFGEVTSTSIPWIRRVELGEENLTIRTMCDLANALGVDVTDLFHAPASLAIRKGRPPKRIA